MRSILKPTPFAFLALLLLLVAPARAQYAEAVQATKDEWEAAITTADEASEKIDAALEWYEKIKNCANGPECQQMIDLLYQGPGLEAQDAVVTVKGKVQQALRQLDRAGLESKLKQAKEALETFSSLGGAAKDALEFMEMFNPEGARGDPTRGLRLIGGAIEEAAEGLPYPLDEMFAEYGKAAAAFADKLTALQAAIEQARQGSLGGSYAGFAEAQEYFEQHFEGRGGRSSLDFFDISSRFPLLGRGVQVFENLGGTVQEYYVFEPGGDVSGATGWIVPPAFADVYRSFAALPDPAVLPPAFRVQRLVSNASAGDPAARIAEGRQLFAALTGALRQRERLLRALGVLDGMTLILDAGEDAFVGYWLLVDEKKAEIGRYADAVRGYAYVAGTVRKGKDKAPGETVTLQVEGGDQGQAQTDADGAYFVYARGKQGDGFTVTAGRGDGSASERGRFDERMGFDRVDLELKSGPDVEALIQELSALTAGWEAERDGAKAACEYEDAAETQDELLAAVRDFVAKSFPGGPPPEVQAVVATFEAERDALQRAATAQEEARVHLREGLAHVRAKRGEPALAALEAAAAVPDVPSCLRDQIVKTYDEMKADLEERMRLIDQAVAAANDRCDYAEALRIGKEVEALGPDLSWVREQLPLITSLEKRQREARGLRRQAEEKAQLAEQTAGDVEAAKKIFAEAIALAVQALDTAPECEKADLEAYLADLARRAKELESPPVDRSLVLLIDTSGSMGNDNKMASAKAAASQAVKSLGPNVEIALLTYDGGCSGGWRTKEGFTTDKKRILEAIQDLAPGGGTPMAPAVAYAQQYLEQQHHPQSTAAQILLLSDGQNDCGSVSDAGAGLRQSALDIRVDAVGFGLADGSQAVNDLNDLVRAAGNGQTHSANTAGELVAAFRRSFMVNMVKPRDPFVDGQAGARLAELFAAAVASLKQNDVRGALAYLDQAVQEQPTSPAAHFNASLAYEAGGQPLQALTHAKQYLVLAPNAFDAGAVRERIGQLEEEQRQNPRALYTPNDCGALYRWAQQESRRTRDAAAKAKVYQIMTTAQRGDCAAAQQLRDAFDPR